MTATEVPWTEVARHLDAVAPGHDYGPDTPFAALAPFHRLAMRRWFAELLVEPTDDAILAEHSTLADAHRWANDALRAGCTRRDRSPDVTTLGDDARQARPRTVLRPIADVDLPELYRASMDPLLGAGWRFRGRTVPADEFVATLHDGIRAQFVVAAADDDRGLGLVSAYDHHQAGQHCKVAFIRFGPRDPEHSGVAMEGMLRFLTHLFTTFPYRKVYAEVPDHNLGLYSEGFADIEGTLREYLFHEGRHIDLHLVAITRAHWTDLHAATGW